MGPRRCSRCCPACHHSSLPAAQLTCTLSGPACPVRAVLQDGAGHDVQDDARAGAPHALCAWVPRLGNLPREAAAGWCGAASGAPLRTAEYPTDSQPVSPNPQLPTDGPDAAAGAEPASRHDAAGDAADAGERWTVAFTAANRAGATRVMKPALSAAARFKAAELSTLHTCPQQPWLLTPAEHDAGADPADARRHTKHDWRAACRAGGMCGAAA